MVLGTAKSLGFVDVSSVIWGEDCTRPPIARSSGFSSENASVASGNHFLGKKSFGDNFVEFYVFAMIFHDLLIFSQQLIFDDFSRFRSKVLKFSSKHYKTIKSLSFNTVHARLKVFKDP